MYTIITSFTSCNGVKVIGVGLGIEMYTRSSSTRLHRGFKEFGKGSLIKTFYNSLRNLNVFRHSSRVDLNDFGSCVRVLFGFYDLYGLDGAMSLFGGLGHLIGVCVLARELSVRDELYNMMIGLSRLLRSTSCVFRRLRLGTQLIRALRRSFSMLAGCRFFRLIVFLI